MCVRDLEVCLDPVDLSEGGGGEPPCGPLEGCVCVCGDPECVQRAGCGSGGVSS